MTATTLSLLFPLRDESLDFLSLNKRWPWGLVYNNQQNMAKVMVWSVQAQALKRRLTTSFSFWEPAACFKEAWARPLKGRSHQMERNFEGERPPWAV